MDGKLKGFSDVNAKSIFVLVLLLLLVEESLGQFSDTAILSLAVALFGAFTFAVLPYVAKSASSVKGSLQCFSLIFLTRVAVAVVPAIFLPSVLLLVTVYGVVLVSCALYIMDRHLSPGDIGFHFSNVPLQVLSGVVLGVVMGFTEFAILHSDIERYLLFQQFTVSNFIVLTVVMFWFVGLGEELLFRGLAQTSLERDLRNPVLALMTVSVTFALMHLGYVTSLGKIWEIVYVYAAATVIGYAFMKTRSLVFPVVAHGVANTILFAILPYLI